MYKRLSDSIIHNTYTAFHRTAIARRVAVMSQSVDRLNGVRGNIDRKEESAKEFNIDSDHRR